MSSLILVLFYLPLVTAEVSSKHSEFSDLLLTSIVGELLNHSQTQLILDVDIFRSLFIYSPDRLLLKTGRNDVGFWRKTLRFLEPLKDFDVAPGCFADVSHLIWQFIQYIRSIEAVDQCDKSELKCSRCQREKTTQIQQKEWVLKVFDSMGKIPAGILKGNNLFVGSWDTCRNVDVIKNRQQQKWRGQYCMAHLYSYNRDNPLKNIGQDAQNQANDECSINNNRENVQSSDDDGKCFNMIPLLNYGLCAPNTCTEYDVKKIVRFLSNTVEYSSNRSIICHIDVVCHNDERDRFSEDNSSILMLSFVFSVLMLMLLGTFYDYFAYQEFLRSFPESDDVLDNSESYQMQPCFVKILLAFSVYSNGKNILRTTKGANQIHCLHGIRVLSMCWIILGHSYYYRGTSLTLDNLIPSLIDFPKHFGNQIIVQGPLAVDTFFFLSGMLTAFLWFRITKRMAGRNISSVGFWGQYYFHRYMRLTPLYLIIMGLNVTLFARFSDGPFWRPIERNYCRISWWTNIIYINNFLLQHDEVCMGWTWYLANDFQFYCFAPILLVLLWNYDKIGIQFCAVLIFISTIIKLAITLIKDLPPAPILTKNLQIVRKLDDYWQDVYIKPYIRCCPYIAGVLIGYLLYKYGLNVKLKRWKVTFGWTISSIVGFVSVFGLYNYSRTGEISKFGSIIYVLLGRNGFTLSLSWLTYSCATGHGGPVNAFLSWKAWLPLSRITFSAYLIHPILLQIYFNSRPETFHFTSTYQMLSVFFAAVVITYFCAFFISVVFEIPIGILEKLTVDSLTKNRKTTEQKNRKISSHFEEETELNKTKKLSTLEENE